MDLPTRINNLIKEVSKNIYEKETVFRLSFLAMLSGESIFLLGKPGIAKSMVARRIKLALKNGKIFEYLMNRFSTPEEIFGSISIKSLQEGKYFRITDKYLPNANIAFLDEIWKSGPSILNNLLTIINEKIFRNDGIDIKVPLWLLISASNELPEPNKGLEALYDRFIIRYIAHPVTKRENFNKMLSANNDSDVIINPDLQITEKEYQSWLKQIKDIEVSKTTLDFIHNFIKDLATETNNEAYISDRRWTKIIKIMKASAFYNNRKFIDKVDWLVIPYCIWDNYTQEEKYKTIFINSFKKYFLSDIQNKKIYLENKIQNLLSEIKYIEKGLVLLMEYKTIFNHSFEGPFFKFYGLDDDYKYCYIKKQDYLELLDNPGIEAKYQLYLSNDENKIKKVIESNLKFKSDGKMFFYSKRKKRKQRLTLYIEKNNFNPDNALTNLKNNLNALNKQFKLINQNARDEPKRLLEQNNIFFTEDLKIFLDIYLNEQKIKENIL